MKKDIMRKLGLGPRPVDDPIWKVAQPVWETGPIAGNIHGDICPRLAVLYPGGEPARANGWKAEQIVIDRTRVAQPGDDVLVKIDDQGWGDHRDARGNANGVCSRGGCGDRTRARGQ